MQVAKLPKDAMVKYLAPVLDASGPFTHHVLSRQIQHF